MKIKLTQDLGDGYVDSIEIEDATLTEALVLTDAFFNDGKRVEEAQESVVDGENEVQESVDWSEAPEWAEYYGKTPTNEFVWYNNMKYKYVGRSYTCIFGNDYYETPARFTEIASRGF